MIEIRWENRVGSSVSRDSPLLYIVADGLGDSGMLSASDGGGRGYQEVSDMRGGAAEQDKDITGRSNRVQTLCNKIFL